MSDAAQLDLDGIERRFKPALLAFFTRRCRDRSDAEDLTQEVFVRLAQAGRGEMRSADAYIFQIAANLLRDRARSSKVRLGYLESKRHDQFADVDPLDPFRIAAARQDMRRLAASIGDLPEKTRRIFVLHRLENVEKKIIAESFGLSVRMVEIHLQRALVALADLMDEGR